MLKSFVSIVINTVLAIPIVPRCPSEGIVRLCDQSLNVSFEQGIVCALKIDPFDDVDRLLCPLKGYQIGVVLEN